MKTILMILSVTALLSAITLTMDSVTVDSVWNSDSAGIVQRDCRVSFIPSGNMKRVWCVPSVSFDGGANWYEDSIFRLEKSIEGSFYKDVDTMLACWEKHTITVRIKGCDRTNVVVRVTGRMPLPSMVSIDGGTFQMGSPWNRPIHSVTITALQMSPTEVTEELYTAVMGPPHVFFDCGATYPVMFVSWDDAALFCNALSKMSGKDQVYNFSGSNNSRVVIDYTKNGYRMPTEAEWEYACRAGSTTDYYWGGNYPPETHDDTLAMDSNVVWKHNSSNPYSQPWVVASKEPNAWGLYDMSGNVWEWVNDWNWVDGSGNDYSGNAQTDPTGPVSDSIYVMGRVQRGGSWESGSLTIRSAARAFEDPRTTSSWAAAGIRLASRP